MGSIFSIMFRRFIGSRSSGYLRLNHIANELKFTHSSDFIMGTIASQITSVKIVYSTVYSVADQRIYQSSASLAFVWRIHRWPVNSPHKWQVTPKIFPFDDVIMQNVFDIYLVLHRDPILAETLSTQEMAQPSPKQKSVRRRVTILQFNKHWIYSCIVKLTQCTYP